MINFYFGFDRLIESRGHIVALSTTIIIKITLDEIWLWVFFQTISDYVRLFQTISDYFRLFQTISDDFSLFRNISISDYFRLFPTIFDKFWLFKTLSGYFGTFCDFVMRYFGIFVLRKKITLEAEVLSTFCSCLSYRLLIFL